MMDKVDLTLIATFHDEDYLIGATLRSLQQAVDSAVERGISIETLLVMDCATETTRRLVVHHAEQLGAEIAEYNIGDQGLVRNSCVKNSKGSYIAFLDGDDLFGFDWLWLGLDATNGSRTTIVHPEFNLFFEGHNSLFLHRDSNDKYFDEDYLRVGNYWDAMCICHRDILISQPYMARDIELGFAYEDWDWNMRTLAEGHEHVIAKDTIHFKRRRKRSQSAASRERGAIHHINNMSYYDYYEDIAS